MPILKCNIAQVGLNCENEEEEKKDENEWSIPPATLVGQISVEENVKISFENISFRPPPEKPEDLGDPLIASEGITTVKGCRIQGNRDYSLLYLFGGGIIQDCVFSDCRNAGLGFVNSKKIELKNCRFYGISSALGSEDASFEMKDCVFQSCGTAVSVNGKGQVKVSGSTFYKNSIAVDANVGTLVLSENNFKNNNNAISVRRSKVQISKNLFKENKCAVYSNGKKLNIEKNTFEGNEKNIEVKELDKRLLSKHDVDLMGIAECIENKVCTFKETGHSIAHQYCFTCLTCARGENVGYCKVCAENCHVGHHLVDLGKRDGFCDCPSVDDKCKFKYLNETEEIGYHPN